MTCPVCKGERFIKYGPFPIGFALDSRGELHCTVEHGCFNCAGKGTVEDTKEK